MEFFSSLTRQGVSDTKKIYAGATLTTSQMPFSQVMSGCTLFLLNSMPTCGSSSTGYLASWDCTQGIASQFSLYDNCANMPITQGTSICINFAGVARRYCCSGNDGNDPCPAPLPVDGGICGDVNLLK